MSRFGLGPRSEFVTDPTGAQVVLETGGRTLLGDVTEGFYDAAGNARLRVRHFNGEAWPFSPFASAVSVLERDT